IVIMNAMDVRDRRRTRVRLHSDLLLVSLQCLSYIEPRMRSAPERCRYSSIVTHRSLSLNAAVIGLALAIPWPAFAQSPEPWWPTKGTVILSGGGIKALMADS